jgi:triacylglycerol esterase/lipase EstA (alpha/beta hydrolase family)
MINYNELKQGDVIHIKGIFGIDCVGIFNKFENNKITLYCASYEDLKDYITFDNYCTLNVDAINACELATEYEIKTLYGKVVNYYVEVVDNQWDKYFTDSTYYEVKDWFAFKCNINNDDEDYPEFVHEFGDFAWDFLCAKMGYEDIDNITDDKMVNLDKVCEHLNYVLPNYVSSDYVNAIVSGLRKSMEK